MVQFLPLLLTHSIRLYMAIPSICRTVLTDLVLKSTILDYAMTSLSPL